MMILSVSIVKTSILVLFMINVLRNSYQEWMISDILDAHIHILHPLAVDLNITAKDDFSMVNEYAREINTEALVRLLHSFGIHVSVHNISLVNYKGVLQSIDRHRSIVVNLCDGTEFEGYPGSSIIEEMDRLKLKYTGANNQFYRISQSKSIMKRQLIKDGVPTMPFIEINEDTSLQDINIHLQSFPVIVKPVTSYASMDITRKSVCFNAEQTLAQARRIRPRALDGVFAEGFLAGREFTVLLVGDSIHGIKVFPAVERQFNVKLSTYERFLDFDLYWDGYGDSNKTVHDVDPFYQYKIVSNDENQILAKLAQDAYEALGGNGYARVDIRTSSVNRMDPTVLEVNAQCSLSFDIDQVGSSMSHVLRLSNMNIEQFTLSIIEYAQKRHY